ncbi:ComEC/Rec2 family competence protein [Vreelandella azerica]|uniref:ComEC/Rec2 family competence protein n=1 Tax=Vreelandella azerica TaxID=2732867 RepID=UPI001F1C5125|nr:ComEC/Rec2 family competence protein [Halomonas azerica]
MRTGIALPAALALLGGVLSVSSGLVQQFPGLFLAVYLLAGLWIANRYFSGLLFWLLWGILVALLTIEQGRALPAGLSGSDLSVEARVLNVSNDNGVARLTLRLLHCVSPPGQPSCKALGKVRVSAYQDTHFQPGERWEMTLRLRPPRGFSNPDTFDYQAWLWRERLHATGYVRQLPSAIRLAESTFSLRRLGLDYLAEKPLAERSRRWLAALTLGDSDQLERQDWDLLNHSGTTHLVVISGLHVGLVRTQLLLAPLTAGAVLLAFGRLAPLAPLINLLAVPWVSLVMVPSAMLGWLLMPVAPLAELSWWVFEQALNLFHGLLTLNVAYLPLWEPSPAIIKPWG